MKTAIRIGGLLQLLFVSGLCCPPAGAGAVGLYGSYWATDDVSQSVGAGAKVKLGLSRLLAFEIRAAIFPDLETLGEDLEMLPMEAGLVIDFDRWGPLNPYLGAGASYYRVSGGPLREVDDEVGWYAVLGGEVGDVSGLAVFLEAIYRGGEIGAEAAAADPLVPPRGELELGGLGVQLGIAWRW